jgi:WD40 repeat protein
MAPVYEVFLSHSSADKPAVEKLAHKLVEAGINPFLDKWHLIPGEAWEEALEEALDQSRTCAVFVGPTGLGPWQNEEMRSALEDRVRNKAFRVIPVLLPGSLEPQGEKLPRFLRRLTWVDFRAGLEDEEAFLRLIHGIRGTSPGPGGGGGGPVLPPSPITYRCMAQPPEGFIHRSEYETVLEALCPKDGTARASPAVGITTALRGAGGFGKTSLAQAICFDESVRQHYPDGILWTTMGENLDPESRVSRILDLIRWWTDTEPPGFKDLQTAGAKLREILNGRRILLVVDDAWSPADVLPFQGLSNASALLITTRDSQTLPENSVRIEVDAMASKEAVSLLRSELPMGEESDFQGLAAQLGEWPLLLKLVNRQLRCLVKEDSLAIPDALKEVKSALESEGFSAFDQDDPESRHAVASRTILVSLRRLAESERDLYFRLAVFPEDAEVPLSILEGYWGLSHFATRKLCGRLYELSLLRDFDVKNGTIRLHDVIRKILIEQIGDGISSLHARLLDSHRPPSGRWPDLAEEDQYLWRNLAGHLLGAGRIAELRDLLVDFPFLEAKLKATGVNDLISDYTGLAGENQEYRLIQGALRLSAHVLDRDKRQLAPQLLGRLLNKREGSIQKLLEGAGSRQGDFWLRPRTASLTQPGGALIRMLEGHTDWVTAVAVVDGGRAVSGSRDGTLRVWDLESGRTLQTLKGHTNWVTALAVLDGGRAVSGSRDGTLRVWDLESGRSLKTLEVHTTGVTTAVWDLERRQSLKTLFGRHTTNWVTAVAVLDGRRAVSASSGPTLRVWDLESGRFLKTLKGHTASVLTVAVLDGRRAVSGSADGTLRVWELESGRSIKTLEGHTAPVRAVAVLDSRRAISASNDGTLRIWDLESGRSLETLEGLTAGITAVAMLGGRRAVSASSDRTLRVWDLENGRSLKTLVGHMNWVTAVAVLDERRAVSASNDRTLRVWDLESGLSLKILEGHMTGVTAVAVLDGRRVVSGSADGTLQVWDLESGLSLKTLEGHTTGVTAVAVLGGRRAVSASAGPTLRVWDLESGRSLKTLEGHTDRVNAVAELDSRRAISASYDGTLRVWDTERGEAIAVMTLDAPPMIVAVSPDGRVVVVWDQAGRMHFFDPVPGH